jgi:diguanylate cyclase (GGDEF)-like protein
MTPMKSSLDSLQVAPAEKLLRFSNVAVFLLALTTYLVLSQTSQFLNNPATNDDTFWAGAGLSLGLLLMLPSRQWLLVIAAIAIAEFGGNLFYNSPIAANLFWTIGNCIEPLIGAALIRRYGNFAGALAPQQNLLRFIAFAVIAAPFIGASIGSIGTFYVLGVPFWKAWTNWFVGDALGVLVIAPMLLSRVKLSNPLHWPREQLVFALLLVITASLILRNWGGFLDLVLPYLFLPYMLWAALRFGLRGTAVTIFFTAMSATVAIRFGYIPFQTATLPELLDISMIQIRLLIISSTALVVAVLTQDLIQGLSNEKRLMQQAHRDELTGLYNRAGLNFRVENSIQRRQSDKPLHLLICDLDAFKPINDKHGHLAGDEVLIEVAARLRSCIRDGDAAGRIGGDEFVVLLDNSDANSVTAIAGRIQEQIAKPVRGSFGIVELSMSIGITQWDLNVNIETAMRAADKALYEAKNSGKNRYVWASTPA